MIFESKSPCCGDQIVHMESDFFEDHFYRVCANCEETVPEKDSALALIEFEYSTQCPNCFVTDCVLCDASRTCLCSCNGTERVEVN